MTAHAPPQFTPAQVLDAGRRAEAEGRGDFAAQFYRHLVDYYPGTAEAAAAREGLARVAPQPLAAAADGARRTPTLTPLSATMAPGPAMPGAGMGQPPAPPPNLQIPTLGPPPQAAGAPPQPQMRTGLPSAAPLAAPPLVAEPREPREQREPGTADLPLVARRAGAVVPVETDPRRRPLELPPPRRDYRTARILARAMTWLGGALAVVAMALLPIAIVSPRTLTGVPLVGPWFLGMGFGIGVVVSGLAMVLAGQVIRALLDQANATRDLAALERARAEQEAGTGPSRVRD